MKNMHTKKYKLSFTGASLSISESVKIADVYLGCKDWDIVKEIVTENNLLQSRTNSRTIRVFRELSLRLKGLSKEQLELLVEGNLQEKKSILWFAICKTYMFIQEFAIEVIHEKYLTMDYELTDLDYRTFFNRKADWHEELDEITEKTRKKLKQVLFRMLRETGITLEDNIIVPSILPKRVVDVLKHDTPMCFQIFPMAEPDRNE